MPQRGNHLPVLRRQCPCRTITAHFIDIRRDNSNAPETSLRDAPIPACGVDGYGHFRQAAAPTP
jgi:hypothetical protein